MRRFLIALASLCALAACGPKPAPAASVRVFAAASLSDALTEASRIYAEAGNAAPVLNFAASSTLARQIEQGADADVFVSADLKWMDYLEERKLIAPESRATLLTNTLVLIAPADRPLRIAIAPGFALRDALAGGKLAMADPESVPAGRYGRAALQSLGVWDDVAASVVTAEDVRAALRLATSGEAAAAIVYRTDALSAGDKVQLVGAFPESSHPPIVYPVAAVAGGAPAPARDFIAFLRSDEAQSIFRRYGFGAPG